MIKYDSYSYGCFINIFLCIKHFNYFEASEFYKLGFISKSGFTADVDKDKYICYNLDDFYKYEGGI